jgi:Sugar phosphate permease
MNFLTPPVAKRKVEPSKVDPTYKKLRWQVFFGIFMAMLDIIYYAIIFQL